MGGGSGVATECPGSKETLFKGPGHTHPPGARRLTYRHLYGESGKSPRRRRRESLARGGSGRSRAQQNSGAASCRALAPAGPAGERVIPVTCAPRVRPHYARRCSDKGITAPSPWGRSVLTWDAQHPLRKGSGTRGGRMDRASRVWLSGVEGGRKDIRGQVGKTAEERT